MTKRERLQFVLLWLLLGVGPLFLRTLWEPDEARYAEIPREMLVSGDWLTPRLNQVLYFEKPPLQYWLSALAMKAFGVNAPAARLPLALATLIVLWSVQRLAGRLGAARPLAGSCVAATTLLAYACHQILTLDALFAALLTLSLTAAVEAVSARCEARPRAALGWTAAAFAANALALLTKGLVAPVLVGGALLGSLPWTGRAPRLRAAVVRLLWDPLGWLVFLAVAAPWFVLVQRANPGHAAFFFVHEHLVRFLERHHNRPGFPNPLLDKLYFAAVLPAGLVPHLTRVLRGLGGTWRVLRRKQSPEPPLRRWTAAVLLLGAAVPFLFFSASASKLPTYILPAIAPLAALAGAFGGEGRTAFRGFGLELLVLGGLLALGTPFLLRETGGLPWVVGAGIVFLGMGAWALGATGAPDFRWAVLLGAGFLLLTLAAQRAVGPRKSVASLMERAPADAQWISLGNYFQGLAFYSGRRIVVVSEGGELTFGRDNLPPQERERWFRKDVRTLGALASKLRAEEPARPVWVLAAPYAWMHVGEVQAKTWEVVERRPSAWLLRLKEE